MSIRQQREMGKWRSREHRAIHKADKFMLVLNAKAKQTHTQARFTTCFWFAASDIKVSSLQMAVSCAYNDLLMFSTYGLWGVIDSNCLLDFAPSFSFLIRDSNQVNTVLSESRVGSANSSQLWRCQPQSLHLQNSIQFIFKLKVQSLLFARPQTSTRPNVFLLSTIYLLKGFRVPDQNHFSICIIATVGSLVPTK